MGIEGVKKILDNIKRTAPPSVEGIRSLGLKSNSTKSSLTKSSTTNSPRTGEGRAPIGTPYVKGCQDLEQVSSLLTLARKLQT